MSQYYKKYMKKREEEKPSYAKLFVGAFLMMIVFFVIVATHLTSSVDTSIGENDEGDIKESGLGVKHLIDSRLRFIQMEDISGNSPKKEKNETIEQYGKTIKEEAESGYAGQYSQSFGYDSTQQARPYSQTYNNTQKQTENATSSNSTSTVNKTTTVSNPQVPAKTVQPTSVPTPKPVTHSIQKNLTPTGMN